MQIIPGMFQDIAERIFHKHNDLQGIEIVHEEEKRRLDAVMLLLYSVLIFRTVSQRLNGVMGRGQAR